MSSPAESVLQSLESEPEADVEAAWRQEVAARMAALEAGDVETTPWEEIRSRLLARLTENNCGRSCPSPDGAAA
jgi:putative addiction module component (TIGR02574 family)